MFLLLAYAFIALLAWRILRLNGWASELNQHLGRALGRIYQLETTLADLQARLAQPNPATPEAPVTTSILAAESAPVAPPPIPAAPAPRPVRATPPPLPASVPTPAPASASRERVWEPASKPATEPATRPETQTPPPVRPIEAEPVLASLRTKLTGQNGGWENLIGENLLNKLGALVLVIGIALFLGYSFTRMGPAGRAFTGLSVSSVILAGGLWMERSELYRLFSRGLIAAGWASLYFTTYAMHALPATQVIDPSLGTLLMALVATGMVLHSLRYRAQTLTALAYACIFAAFALSQQGALLVVALVPLAVSMLYLANRFQWYGLALFGAAATYLTFLTRPDSGASLLSIQALLLLYWTLFETFDLLRIRANAQAPKPEHSLRTAPPSLWTNALFALNALGGLGASAAIWYRFAPESMWRFCAGAAAIYLASTCVRMLFDRESLYEYSLTIATFLAALGIFAGVPGLWTSIALLAEAEILFLAGLYLGIRFARELSLFGFAIAAAQLLARFDDAPVAILDIQFDVWAPPLAVMAAIFYLNRYLAKEALYFGYFASGAVCLILGGELPLTFTGMAALLFAATLFELGIQRNLLDFRLQSYAVTILSTSAMCAIPLADRIPWEHAAALAIPLTTAIRAALGLRSVPPEESGSLRTGASISSAILTALFVFSAMPQPYWGVAIIGSSLLLLELALRGIPAEMRIPAGLLNLSGLALVLSEHLGHVQKQPVTPTWIGFLGAALSCYYLTARILKQNNLALTRRLAPWAGTAFAIPTLWMLLPDRFVPAAIGALALATVEAGLLLGVSNLVLLGRVTSGVATLSLSDLAGATHASRIANTFTLAGLQWLLWFRTRGTNHGWTAAALIAFLIPLEWSDYTLALWSLFGIALALSGHFLQLRHLRWQSAALAAFASAASFFIPNYAAAPWQHALMAAWFVIALSIEDRAGIGQFLRNAYSTAVTLLTAFYLWTEVSGGLLTLSWSGEAVVLLALGFALRERALRLSGLTLLLTCIGKVFFYDLRNLDTLYRILSFIGLGVMLLLVSWVYTRFKQQLARYL